MVNININIEKRHLWLISAVFVFLIGVGIVIAFNPSGTGGNPAVMGHSADEIEGGGGQFGDWGGSYVRGGTYQVNSDGFVYAHAKSTSNGGDILLELYTGPSGSLGLRDRVLIVSDANTDSAAGVFAPIKSGHYFKVVGCDGVHCNTQSMSIKFMPVGA